MACSNDSSDLVTEEESPVEIIPSTIVFKIIPAGTFTMGGSSMQNDAPLVSIEMSATEITNQQYIDFLNDANSEGWILVEEQSMQDPCGSYTEYAIIGTGDAPNSGEMYVQLGETGGCTSGGEEEHINNKSWIKYNETSESFELLDSAKGNWPVNGVKWYGANAYAQFYDISLPTEAQWEYAARGGNQQEYATDNGNISLEQANYNGDQPGFYNPEGHSFAVASYAANPYGLYDMSGNVWEWCSDYYSEDFYTDGATNPENTSEGIDAKRVRRGGSWNYHAATLLTYARASDFQNRGNNHFGFRVVKN